MTLGAAGAVLAVLLAVILVLALVAGLGRGVRAVRERSRRRLAAPARPVLMRVVAGEGDDRDLAWLAGLDARHWSAVEPVAAGLLGKVSGEAHGNLVGLLQRRGTLKRAARDCGSRSAVRRARGADLLGAARRREDGASLVPLLRDRDHDVRQVAARALGRIGDASAADAVLAAVHDAGGVLTRTATGALL
ncbi:HEAT repeat domain-containing protein, partial [Cellulomonas bogoriensis]|uniref:HEAT repeat domain-containing protein n=1 Tax=Cellulomonas bogoriensis TaxID=301388 RepID=UPI002FBED52F